MTQGTAVATIPDTGYAAWPAAQTQPRVTASLVPYAQNSRTHSKEQIAEIARSIKEFGFTNPVLIDEDGTIIAGHGRVMAAHKLHLPQVPTMTTAGWTDAQKRAYVIADNKIGLNAGWDLAVLSSEIKALDTAGFDLTLTGFSIEELGDLTLSLSPEDSAPFGRESDETGSGMVRNFLSFGSEKIAITDEELAGLNDLLGRHTERFGAHIGFAAWLMGYRNSGA